MPMLMMIPMTALALPWWSQLQLQSQSQSQQ
jgi:hypothetical protein